MLSVSALGSASRAVDYYEHLAGDAVEDYYAAAGAGEWVGAGAEHLGLAGDQTSPENFRDVAEGYDPNTGRALVQRPGEKHRAGWDLTFSAPKSVSTVWAVADENTRAAIEEAHQAAVGAALSYVERNHLYTRTGHGGPGRENESARREHVGMVGAVYQHGTSRNQDPQLHSHAVVANVGIRADGSSGALDPQPLYQAKMAAGAAYQAQLAHELRARGFEVQPAEKFGIELVGVPENLQEHWSSRRTEIEAALKAEGRKGSAAESEKVALATRRAKENLDAAELRERWAQEAHQLAPDFSPATLRAESPTHAAGVMPTATEAARALTENSSVFRQKDLDRMAFEHAQKAGYTAAEAEAWAHDVMRSGGVVELAHGKTGEKVYTTQEMLAIERGIIARGQQMAGAESHGVGARHLDKALGAAPTLSDEQRAMVEHVTAPGKLKIVEGQAGTGKSFALGVAREAWEREGYQVRGAAVAGKAAEGLQSGAGIDSTTVARTLMDTAEWTDQHGRTHPPAAPLTDKTVLVVDEAGMIGSRQLDTLMQRADEAGAKVVLVGDSGQLQPIDAGAPFRDLSEKLGAAELADIRRQQAEADRQAVRDLADGNATAALDNLAGRDRVHVTETATEAREAAGRAVVEDMAEGKNSLAIAATRADVRAINQSAREVAQEAGLLGESVAVQTTVGARDFAEGDRMVFLKNDKGLDVKNGDFGTVKGVTPSGTITVELDRTDAKGNPVTKTIDPQTYASIDHGYAATAHKSQGATVDTAHIYTGGAGMESREWAYVAGSRAREATHIHADEITAEELGGTWSREGQAESTAAYAPTAGQDSQEQHVPETSTEDPLGQFGPEEPENPASEDQMGQSGPDEPGNQAAEAPLWANLAQSGPEEPESPASGDPLGQSGPAEWAGERNEWATTPTPEPQHEHGHGHEELDR